MVCNHKIKMSAAVAYEGMQDFQYEEVSIEEPRDNEILVKIAGVGLCHTDLLGKGGMIPYPFPAVFGHEGAGIVEQVGAAVTKVKTGDAVVLSFRSCNHCDRCDESNPAYCRTLPELNFTGRRDDGSSSLSNEKGAISSNFFGQSSFGDYAMCYEANIVKVDKDLPIELMGPLGCGIQTGVGAVTRSLSATKGSSILIAGGGTVGLSAVMGAVIAECSAIILVEPMASRRELAKSFGATHCIDPSSVNSVSEEVRSFFSQGLDYAIDATGIPAVQQSAFKCLGSKGVLGLVGVTPPGVQPPGSIFEMINSGITIKGIMEGDSEPDSFIPELIIHYKAGRLPFDQMIKTYKLSEINQAVAEQHNGDVVKAVMIPESE